MIEVPYEKFLKPIEPQYKGPIGKCKVHRCLCAEIKSAQKNAAWQLSQAARPVIHFFRSKWGEEHAEFQDHLWGNSVMNIIIA